MLKTEYELLLQLVKIPETYNLSHNMQEISLYLGGYALASLLYDGSLFSVDQTLDNQKPKVFDHNWKMERVVDLHYLAEKKYETPETRGWAGLIDKYSKNWEEAKQALYEILDEYLLHYPLEKMETIEKIVPIDNFSVIYKKIKIRPGVYIGQLKINALKIFLEGYGKAWKELCGKDSFGWYKEVQKYISDKYCSEKTWTETLLSESGDEASAIDLFFELIEESNVDISK